MKKLENLTWKPKWVSHLGCLQGCLDYLNIKVSDAWLFGATGHAFIINIHDVVCPSGPTAWNTEKILELGGNLGCRIEKIVAFKSQPDFAEKQKLAWDKTRHAIENGIPCYGWELFIPEYYVVNGYDESGYLFNGPMSEGARDPKAWKELGDSGIGVLEMAVVKPGRTVDDATVIKEALQFAVEHSKNPEKWILPKYKSGLEGYDNWINALKEKKAVGMGAAYNAAVWHECRQHAVDFLREAKGRIADSLHSHFDKAIKHYETVSQNLDKVADLFPFMTATEEQKDAHIKDDARCEKAVAYLTSARQAERSGLETIAAIAEVL